MIATKEETRKIDRNQNEIDEVIKMTHEKKQLARNWNTDDGVNFKGGRM